MGKTPEVSTDAWKNLYAAAAEFAALKPWDHFEDSTVFGIQDPAAGQMGYACVLGALGEMFALCVYRGAEGFDIHRRMQKGEFHRNPEEIVAIQNCLMAEFADWEELDKSDRAVIRKLGLSFREPNNWPLFRSHLPAQAPWYLTPEEAAYLTLALRCAFDAASKVMQGKLNLEEKPGQVFCYSQNEGTAESNFETHWEPEPIYRPEPAAPFDIDADKLARIKDQSPKPDSAWEADVFCIPAALTDRERPYFPRCSLVVHQASHFIIHSNITPPARRFQCRCPP